MMLRGVSATRRNPVYPGVGGESPYQIDIFSTDR